MKSILTSVFFFIFILSAIPSSSAFDNVITHRDITDKAIFSSQIDQILIDRLGFNKGIDTIINYTTNNSTSLSSSSIIKLIKEGAYAEDTPACRAANHFHNPIRNSGVTDFLYKNTVFADAVKAYFLTYCNAASPEYIPWHSNLEWATGSTKNERDWRHTRNAYYRALTSATKQERENYFAATFYGLGHVLHLLQDTAVPAHTRNDFLGHLQLVFDPSIRIEGFENFIKNKPWYITSAAAINIINSSPTNYWDSNLYNGANPEITAYQGGLSEYANANFLSRSTMLTEILEPTDVHYFPYPRNSSTVLVEEVTDNGGKIYYLKKYRDGETVNHLAVAGRFFKHYADTPKSRELLRLDDKCFEDYAKLLIPKSVGYSAGLLNYFFRGDIDIVSDDATGSGYVIANNSDEDMEGQFELWYDNKNNERVKVSGADWSLSIGKKSSGKNKSANITFSTPADAKESNKYLLAFKGKLGKEEEAVVAGKVELKNKKYVFLMNEDMQKANFEIKIESGKIRLAAGQLDISPEKLDGSYNMTITSNADNTKHIFSYPGSYWNSYSWTVVKIPPRDYIKEYGVKRPQEGYTHYGAGAIYTMQNAKSYFFGRLYEIDGNYQLHAHGRRNYTLDGKGELLTLDGSVWKDSTIACSRNYVYRYKRRGAYAWTTGGVVATDQAGSHSSILTEQGWTQCTGPSISNEIIAALGDNKALYVQAEWDKNQQANSEPTTYSADFYKWGNNYTGKFDLAKIDTTTEEKKIHALYSGNELIDTVDLTSHEYVSQTGGGIWGGYVYIYGVTGKYTGVNGCGGTPDKLAFTYSLTRSNKTGGLVVNDYDNLNGDEHLAVLYRKTIKTEEQTIKKNTSLTMDYCYPFRDAKPVWETFDISDIKTGEEIEQLVLAYKIPGIGTMKQILHESKWDSKSISPFATSGYSVQLGSEEIVYTYAISKWNGTNHEFDKRVVGIINISDTRLPAGYRQEFMINSESFPTTGFDYARPAAIGVHNIVD